MKVASLRLVSDALEPMRNILRQDGYDVEVSGPDADEYRIAIVAVAGACSECLVPRQVLEPMIAGALEDVGILVEWQLTYPDQN